MPTISIVLPAYQAAATLPRALASLCAQSHEEWECIVVDDGSDDDTGDVAEGLGDRRIRLIRLPDNRGRGVARQRGLEAARGDYLAMVDADDWVYPDKLARQLAVLEDDPSLALVSASMAVVDDQNELVGIQRSAATEEPLRVFEPLGVPEPLRIAHAPSMVRMTLARQQRYDAELRLSQDFDFLLPLAMRYRHAALRDAVYAYAAVSSVSLEKVRRALGYSRRVYRKHRMEHPVAARLRELECVAKSAAYGVAERLHLDEMLIRRRAGQATASDRRAFEEARAVVDRCVSAPLGVAARTTPE